MIMHPTRTRVAARSQSADSQSPVHTDSSFFTFIIALLILVFASGALVLRALLLRRRFRSRVQAAIQAGILPSRPLPDEKPKLSEIWVHVASDATDWHALMPVCATKVAEHTDSKSVSSIAKPMAYRPSPAGRLMEFVGHHPVVTAVNDQPQERERRSKRESMQVAVLIAMPAEHPLLAPNDLSTSPASPKGKQRYSVALHEDAIPDVAFGVTIFSYDTDDS